MLHYFPNSNSISEEFFANYFEMNQRIFEYCSITLRRNQVSISLSGIVGPDQKPYIFEIERSDGHFDILESKLSSTI